MVLVKNTNFVFGSDGYAHKERAFIFYGFVVSFLQNVFLVCGMNDPNAWNLLLAFSPLLLVALVGVVLMHIGYKRGLKVIILVDEGVYEKASYGGFEYERRSGAMAHTTSHHVTYKTAIYFNDGRTRVISGLHNMEYPAGTAIKIYKNGNGAYWIEADTPKDHPQ